MILIMIAQIRKSEIGKEYFRTIKKFVILRDLIFRPLSLTDRKTC